MTDSSDLASRIQRLEDIEAIKRLKAKYWNSVDRKDWSALADCLAEDCTFDTPQLKAMQGRDFIIKVLQRAMRNVTTAHQGHNPEIEILTGNTARGRWALNDRVELQDGKRFNGYGHYDEEYVKENGAWKICQSRLTYLFQENPS